MAIIGDSMEDEYVAIRVPKRLLELVDELRRRGIYKSRDEAVVDGLKHVVAKHGSEVGPGYLYALYRMGLTERDLSLDDLPVTPPEEAEKVKEAFKELSAEEVIDIVRRRTYGSY